MSLQVENVAGKALMASLIFKIVSIIGPIILIPMFVRYLTAEEYGVWLMILSISSYFYLTNPGITQVVSNAIARDITTEKVSYYSKVASSGYYLFLKITFSVFILATIVFISAKTFSTTNFMGTHSLPLIITISSILLTYPLYVYRSVLRGLDHIHIEQIYGIFLGSLFRYALTIVCLLSGFKLIALSIIFAVSNFLPSLGAKAYLKKVLPKFRISRRDRASEITKKMVKPTTSFFILLASGSLLHSADNIIIGSLVGASSVPMYAVPMQILWLFITSTGLHSSTRMPLISGLYKERQFEKLQSLFRTFLFFSSMAAFIFIINLIFFGEIIIVSWAGPEIFPGNDVFYLMLIFAFLFCVLWPSDSILTATEKHSGYANMTIIEAIINVILSIYLTYKFGIKGAVSGTIISRLLTNGWFMFYQTLKILEYKLTDFIMWVLKNILFSMVILSSVIFSLAYIGVLDDYPLYIQILIFNFLIFLILIAVSRNNMLKVLDSLNIKNI